ncbi:helix-turn-helix domain-containing protein [Streptomyces sp. T-3]|nr:helix-turn-helix domain-containing protein [Streptomyces sp. T-3]
MHLRYSFRIEPTPGQRLALARTFGCARVVYNDAHAARKAAYAADKSRTPTGLAAGQAERLNAPGGPVSPGVAIPHQARHVERGTHPKAQPATTGSQTGTLVL